VAGQCGITSAQLSQIELGKSATGLFNLARVCSALGVSLEQLVRGL
jgi:transcriptional regulator with XRE-family HTH domain